jgi:uncharacterized protein
MAKIKKTPPNIDLIDLKEVSNSQLKRILALNNQFAKETSKLDIARLEFMIENAHSAIAITPDIAFFLAYDENSEYDGTHFTYLKQKHNNFLYLDRIVVKKSEQGMGIGSGLYEVLLEIAEELEVDKILCEVNINPVNEASVGFHENFGFDAIEDKIIDETGKEVRYYQYEL